VAAWSKAWVYGQSFAGNAGLNPTRDMDACLLWQLCVLSGRGLCNGPIMRLEDCLNEYDWGTSKRHRPTRAVEPGEKKIYTKNVL